MKKNYKLMGTESDPVIIAQRLLNLYRQLHIFSQEKKEAYNQMLMEQNADVRRALGNLPGGIVVQQYLMDIEEEAGMSDDELKVTLNSSRQDEPSFINNGNMPAGAPVYVASASDPSMIQGIVEAFKEVMVTSEKNRKEDTKELAQTIVALQSKVTQTMMGKVSAVSEGGTVVMPPMDDIVMGVTKAQSELIKELAQTQTQELSKLISNVLKEIQQMSTQTLIDAVQTVQRENIDFFKNQIFSSVSMVPMSGKVVGNPVNYSVDNSQAENRPTVVEPVSLDSYEDNYEMPADEPLDLDNFDEQPEPEPVAAPVVTPVAAPVVTAAPEPQPVAEEVAEDEYEWEYVEDDSAASDDEYEWEYVEDDSAASDDEYEWEYVEEDNAAAEPINPPQEKDYSQYNKAAQGFYEPEEETAVENVDISEDDIPDSIELPDDFGLSLDDDE